MKRWKSVWITAQVLGLAVGVAAAGSLSAQATATVQGTISDSASRRPIEGAQVQLAGTTRGALTNAAGEYSLVGVPAGSATLRVLRIGYGAASREVTLIAGQTAIADFVLRAVAQQLTEMVVTGYGTSLRREVSNAVATVRGDQIVNQPVAGVDQALQGKAAGVQVIQNAGNPGVGITVRVRGSASLSASNQPLYVIDGVPMIREDYSQLDMGGQDVTAVTGLSANEIASIDVLKDAAAAAMYGSRGSNGVVMITTKRGLSGQPRISFNAYTGWQRIERKVDLMSGSEFVEFMYEAGTNDGYTEEELEFDWFGFGRNAGDSINTDWQEEVLQSAPVRDFSLQASGGSDRIQYFLSGAHFEQEGIIIGSRYNRQNVRANVDFRANDRLALRSSIGLLREDNDRNENDNTLDGVTTNVIALPPIFPARNPDGSYTSTDDGLAYTNPVAIGNLDAAETRTFRALGNIEGDFNITDRLKWTSRLGMDVLNLRDLRWNSPQIIGRYAASVNGVAQQGNNTATRYLLESFATLDHGAAAARLSLVGGASVEYNESELDFLQGEGFSNEAFRYPGNAGKVTVYDGDKTGHNLVSFFTRANIALRDRYFVAASLRTDGSSRFGDNNRYGIFPAVSVGWMLSEEPFMQGVGRLGDFKLRASYGVTGNQGIGDDFAPLARFGKANYSDEPGIAPSSIGNPDLKWETTRELDIGFDFFILDGRVGLIGDYYTKKTNDLLVFRPITRTSGFSAFWDNIGNIENRGFELGLATVNFQPAMDDGFRWSTDLNVSWNRNRVTELFRGEPFNSGIRSVNRVEEGQPLGAFHTLVFEGVDPETGDAIYTDLNGDGQINSDDRAVVGSPHPDSWGGLTNTFSWKGFDMRAFFQFSRGAEVYNAMRIFADDGGYYSSDNKFADVLRRWQQPGDITNVPRASFDGLSGARDVSSRFIEDGSYIRFQELSLGYRLPSAFATRANLTTARLFVSARNLKTWTDYLGYNPDVNSLGSGVNISLGTDFYAYPLARTITIGISGDF
ncbi:MAG: TonB-dependent receptor [Gemmatimonadota bacterium]|nr:TonB-dependent receptor [Gemmatimonadota bacterium]